MKKKSLDKLRKVPCFHEREVWFVKLGVNIRHEQDGGKDFLRPVLIIKKFSRNLFWAVPLSRTSRRGKYYHELNFKGGVSVIVLSQLRLIDAARLSYYKGRISNKEFRIIKEKLCDFLK